LQKLVIVEKQVAFLTPFYDLEKLSVVLLHYGQKYCHNGRCKVIDA